VQRMLMVVDLPAPLGPKRPKISPSFTEKEMPSTARRGPKFLIKLWTSIAAKDLSCKKIGGGEAQVKPEAKAENIDSCIFIKPQG